MTFDLPRLVFSKNWEDPADFPTKEYSETQVRKDIQQLYSEIQSFINGSFRTAIENALELCSIPSFDPIEGDDDTPGSGVDLPQVRALLVNYLADYLPLRGGTLTGPLILHANPDAAMQAATKQYVDSQRLSASADWQSDVDALAAELEKLKKAVSDNAANYSSMGATSEEIAAMLRQALQDYMLKALSTDDVRAMILDALSQTTAYDTLTPEEINALINAKLSGIASGIVNDNDELWRKILDLLGDIPYETVSPDDLTNIIRQIIQQYLPTLNADGEIIKRVENELGDFSEFGMTADEIYALVKNILGQSAEVSITADEIRAIVQDEMGQEALLRILADRISAMVTREVDNSIQQAGIDIDPEQIRLIAQEIVDGEIAKLAEIYVRADGIVARVREIAQDEIDKLNLAEVYVKANEIGAKVQEIVDGEIAKLAQIYVTADEVGAQVEEFVNGEIAKLAEIYVRSDEIAARVENIVEGKLAELSIDEDGIVTRVADQITGQYSTFSQTVNAIEQRVQGLESAAGQTITDEQILQIVRNYAGSDAFLQILADAITMQVQTTTTDGETVSAGIQLKIGDHEEYGQILMSGNVDISGQLSADALYATQGEVSDLQVDRVSTARKIPRFLVGDTSDLNYVKVEEQVIQLITASTNGAYEQAYNPSGLPLYWPMDVSSLSRGSDGYPLDGAERVFTTTRATAYPVYVYTYTEAVKRQIAFGTNPITNVYEPLDVYGAGNESGNNKGYIYKGTEGFDLRYITPDGKNCGISMTTGGKVIITGQVEYQAAASAGSGTGSGTGGGGSGSGATGGITQASDGYMNITGLRKTTALDFSSWGLGLFTETVDGSSASKSYTVAFDDEGRPTRITDSAGHETTITW